MPSPVPLINGARSRQPLLTTQPGTVCAVSAPDEAGPGSFLWSALLTAASTSIVPAWLLTSQHTPAALAVPSALAPSVAAALAKARIRILRHQLALPTPAQVRIMLAEFDHFSIVAGALLIIDCADYWLRQPARAGKSPLIDLLQQWAQRRQVAVLLLLHGPDNRNPDRATQLLGFARYLSGVARLVPAVGAAHDSPAATCRILYWFADTAVCADVELTLTFGADGSLQVDESSAVPAEQAVMLDSASVIVQRSALAGSGGTPPDWIICDTLEDVLQACRQARAATVILTFERTTPQDHLMQVVYRLRSQSGNRLKIIVRELQVRLRYNEETLIARMGANLVIPVEVGYARFLNMMEMLQTQVFDAALPSTYEQALADGLPQQEAGYLAPQAFAATVAAALVRSRSLAIDNVLVRLTLAGGLTALDAMRHCTVRRAGDVYSCDRRTVLVFLFACREMDATQTLDRLFALPVGELFSSEHRYISNLAATTAIEDFAARAAGGRLPDLSAPLQEILALRMPLAAPATATGTTDSGAGRFVVPAPVAVTPPMHTPLSLRTLAPAPAAAAEVAPIPVIPLDRAR